MNFNIFKTSNKENCKKVKIERGSQRVYFDLSCLPILHLMLAYNLFHNRLPTE